MRANPGLLAVLTFVLVMNAGCVPLFGEPTTNASVATFTPLAALPATLVPTPTLTASPEPFALELTPLPSATALPALELPTQPAFLQGTQVWDGLPTYPAESRPDFYFRVLSDPNAWALTTNQFGYPALASRTTAGCVISPAVGRGLPLSGSVSHEVRRIREVTYQVSRAVIGGAAQFVTYAGGNGVIYTAFEVSFSDSPEACLESAEGVLGTLRSVPILEATPVGNP